jgi:hypothetical protein
VSYGCRLGKDWFYLKRQSFHIIPIELATKRCMMMERTFLVEMVLMRLIKADKRLAERIQKKLNFSNYQMLCLSWAIGLVMGVAIAILFF